MLARSSKPPLLLVRHAVVVCRAVMMLAAAPAAEPSTGDSLVFRPSGDVPHLEPGAKAFRLDTPTVRALAQLYADFSQREVQVAPALADRPLQTPWCQAPNLMVLVALNMSLRTDHLKIVNVSTGVVAIREFDSGDLPAARRHASQDEMTRARAAMNTERFWNVIDDVRATARTPQDVAARVSAALQRLTADEIFGFEIELQQRFAESYRWDLWAVADLVNGGSSNDGFLYFRAWLIAQGRDYFETALRDPERAADRAVPGRDDHECEPLLHVADQAFRRKTGHDLPLLPSTGPAEPVGTRWEEGRIDEVFPNLARRFQ